MPPKKQKRGALANVIPTVEGISRTWRIASMKRVAILAEEPHDDPPQPAADTDTREDMGYLSLVCR